MRFGFYGSGVEIHRGISAIRNTFLLGPYSGICLEPDGGPRGGGCSS